MAKASAKTLEYRGQKIFGYAPKTETSESVVLAHIMTTLAVLPGVHVMRNNVGVAKHGKRFVRHGLGNGSADIIALVGPHGKFVGCEVKKPKGGKTSEAQEKWIARVRQLGGIAGIVTSVDEALALIDEARKP